MLKLIIGNRAYSSWSMRGWLACKQSGEQFEEFVVPLFDDKWEERRHGDDRALARQVPILWDGDIVVWDSLAIIEFLADRFGPASIGRRTKAPGSRRSMAAEMHSGFANLRRELPMNVRKTFPPRISATSAQQIDRIMQLWAQARARWGGTGDFLFGDWCAADICTPGRHPLHHLRRQVPNFAGAYMKCVLSHPAVNEWIDKAQDEPWVIDQYEAGKAA